MSRFLFVVPPLTGHVNPTIPVGRELAGRGHDDDLRKDRTQRLHDMDDERLTVEGEQGLGPAHSRAPAARQHDAGG